jgi:predicted permease
MFDVLQVEAALGRRLLDGDGAPGAERVVLVSDALWRRWFAADPAAIGQPLRIDGAAHTIVGVMPRTFGFPAGADLWRPLPINAADPIDLWARSARSIGRLRPGANATSAREELRRLVPPLRERFPWKMPADYGSRVEVTPLRDALVGDLRGTLVVLASAVGAVLLVLVVNVANLLLTRGLARDRELATRAAIGATRGRLVQQLAVESLTVAAIAGALGIAVAAAGLRVIVAWLPADVPRASEIQLDGPVLLAAVGLTLAAGLFFGVVPAIRASARSGTASSLRAVGTARLQWRERRLARAFAIAELALAVVLVVSAALLARSLANLMAVDPGFQPAPLVTATVAPPPLRYDTPARRRQFAAELVGRVRDLPGVRAAAAASALPFAGGVASSVFSIEGRPDPAGESGEWPGADVKAAIGPEFLGALATPVVSGRGFTDADRDDAPPVALVSRALARRYWGERDPTGARIRFPGRAMPWVTIVGVVGDVKWQQLGDEPSPFFGGTAEWLGTLFVPLAQADADPVRLVVRAEGAPAPIAAQLRDVIRAVDADAAVADIATGDALVAAAATRPRAVTLLILVFAAVALALSAVGVYAVLAYSVSRRTQEFAVRLALGGTRADILRAVAGEGLRLTLTGVALGIAGAFAATRILSRLLFGVGATDPAVFAAVAATLLTVGLLASYLPARRAMRVDPVTALHGD